MLLITLTKVLACHRLAAARGHEQGGVVGEGTAEREKEEWSKLG